MGYEAHFYALVSYGKDYEDMTALHIAWLYLPAPGHRLEACLNAMHYL